MHIGTIGPESLGVRGLCCIVEVKDRRIVIRASDIQLLDGEAVALILAWRPDIVLVGGPPLYLPWLSLEQRERARENALRLARAAHTLILDHHLLRPEEGLSWLERLALRTTHDVICAARFVEHPLRLLEAWRVRLYEEMPIPEGWHQAHARSNADTSLYQGHALELPATDE